VSEWKRWYIQWDKGFSAGMTILGAAVVTASGLEWPLGFATKAGLSILTVLWALVGLSRLYLSVPSHTTADRVTMLRLGFGSAAVVLIVAAELAMRVDAAFPGYRALLTGLLVVAVVSDFFDGRVARSAQASRFGAEWDMQNDAAFAMLLSVAALAFVEVHAWVILIGLARYLFVLAVPRAHEDIATPRAYEMFGKTVCAVAVLTLAGVVADGASGAAAQIALGIALGAILGSFGWFTLLLRRERATAAYSATRTHGSERVTTID
jgi:phosphatidylglycerophosphate synthase